jgi:hypothetical protein
VTKLDLIACFPPYVKKFYPCGIFFGKLTNIFAKRTDIQNNPEKPQNTTAYAINISINVQ